MTDREKLIEEARRAYLDAWAATNLEDVPPGTRSRNGIIAALAVFEKAHTPTDDEREALIAEGRDWEGALESPTARDVVRRLTDALDGFRRSEIPEPKGDWYDTHCPTCDAPEPWHTATCAVVHVKVPEQGEPSDALDLDALEALAKAATPGPWTPYETVHADNYVTAGGGVLTGTVVCGPTYERENTAFIAAANPQTVLALIAAQRAGGVR